jgi:hypothetical protein
MKFPPILGTPPLSFIMEAELTNTVLTLEGVQYIYHLQCGHGKATHHDFGKHATFTCIACLSRWEHMERKAIAKLQAECN